MYDNDQKMALLTRLSLWDQEVVEAVLRILISEELSNYHRLLEIKRVHCRFLSGRTRYPTTSTPPNLTIPELVILLLPPSPTSDFAAVEPSPPAPLATVASSNLDRPPSRPTTPSVAPSLSRNPAVEPPYPSTSTHTLPIDQNPLPSPPPPFLQNNQHVDPLASLPTFDLKASHPPNGSQPTSSTSNQSTAASDLSLDSYLVLPTLLAVDAAHQPSSSSDSPPFANIRRWQKMEEKISDSARQIKQRR
ncbi:hypothetical protein BDY24DRAFT_414582 [Mrakia frigida]|uniref:uncharacterized protein n=1 Tax=Mrakia frigida TaxID=29902 RepID=UPI003FCC168F